MITPPQQIIQNGLRANDGTGDTLRDAADKINDNFARIWTDFYNGIDVRPAREFSMAPLSASPDSGEFSVVRYDLDSDADQTFKISAWDVDGKKYHTNAVDTISDLNLSLWEKDSGTESEFSLRCIYKGDASYDSIGWSFTSTSKVVSEGLLDSSKNYYIKVDGLW